MTWQGKRRKQLPGNWGTLRKQRLELDGYRCTATVERTNEEMRRLGSLATQRLIGNRCIREATEVHHTNGPADHRLTSLRSICSYHHNLETQAEAQAAKKPRKRTTQPHPGLK